ncbi:serine/threonine-protein kinase [Allocoleopsis franciscana]|uniref:Protein kinase family protein n=1 Tax=Allocoleopsis franciscana PCC 7113 TaxID=1173027 RepID=K9W929_9CYAN|nr:serine/threonine-protein kinase [Allocoleopsis franciscana]AFZ16728.1 protein kinase family protein [Allocoleopsis franciscana PCC 7113]
MTNIQTITTQISTVRINQYILLEEIGRGSHGIVYKAYNEEQPHENLALKIIDDTRNIDSLLVEPELLSRLSHPNIINLEDYFIHAGKLVLITEYINGIDLQSYLEQRGKLTVEEIKVFLAQMADALAHAHANNIIHRDIKLGNILVTGDDHNRRFVLVDFGISRMAEGIQTVKRIAGTYYYMAPEQLRGRPCEQSDLWALGVCAYTLLTGIKPFEGDTEENLSKKIFFSIPQAPSETLGEIDPELENILSHLLEKELINRTTSANELRDELKNWSKSAITEITSQQLDQRNSSNFSIPTWEEKEIKELKKSWIFFWIFAFLQTIPDGIVGEAFSMTGVILFFFGQEKNSRFRTISGIFILIVGFLVGLIISGFIYQVIYISVGGDEIAANSISNGFNFISFYVTLPFSFISVHFLTKVRHLQENLLLHKTLREASRDSKKILQLLKEFININWGNMNVRQKYIELLLVEGKIEEAIIEAKLTLEVDPYNFGATLLLANGYFEAGLYEECIQVCNSYLSISSYSFEFSDLKDKCEQIVGV